LSDSAAPLADLVVASYKATTGNNAPVFLTADDEALLDDLEQGLYEAAIVYYLPVDSDLWFSPIALDGVAIMAHPDLAVDNLTSDQLLDILSGSVTNWAELGGPDLTLNLLVREPGSGARDVLQQRLMGDASFSRLARIAPSDDFMQQEILATQGAIGYSMMGNARGKIVNVDGVAPTIQTVTDQSYALTTPIYFIALVEPTGPSRDFLAWIQSPDGQAVLGEKYGRVR
jgi:phosphate transport system substrate-binding protein